MSALESGEDGESLFGPAGFEDDFAERQRGERCLRRGLEDDRAAGGEGGRNLVRDQVEREVERRDGQDGADGKALDQSPAAFVAFGQVEGDGFAAQAHGFFGGGLEGEHGAIDFSAGQAQGLAGFGDDELSEALLLLDEGGGDVFEDFAAFPTRKGAGAAQAGDGVIDGLARIGAGGDGDAAHEALVPRRADFERLAVDPFLAAEQKSRLRARGAFSWRALLRFLETMVLGRGEMRAASVARSWRLRSRMTGLEPRPAGPGEFGACPAASQRRYRARATPG